MEMENRYASKGVGGTALGIGIGALGLELLRGGAGGLLNVNGNTCGCNEDHYVNRYEATQNARIAELETEVKLRDSNIYTDQKILELYKYVDGKFAAIDVYTATNTATLNCIAGQVAQLQSLTKTIIPITNVCPEPMKLYNSWTAPTAPATGA